MWPLYPPRATLVAIWKAAKSHWMATTMGVSVILIVAGAVVMVGAVVAVVIVVLAIRSNDRRE
jgi:hypothetical protein